MIRLVFSAGGAAARKLRAFGILLAFLAVASCGGVDLGNMFSDTGVQPPSTQGPVTPVKVALLLPLSAKGQTATIADGMKKAAELALFEAGKSNVTLISKDTGGNPQTAAAAAQAAIAEGAEIILGPLLGSEVVAVTPVANAANVPVIAFSTVSSVARPGIYLMSFLPEDEVSNLVRHLSQTRTKNLAAFIPQSQYGAIVARALKQQTARQGINLVVTEQYDRRGTNLTAAATRLATAIRSPTSPAQALFLPEGGRNLGIIANALTNAGIQPGTIKLTGTGLWDGRVAGTVPLAVGGWYAGVAPARVQAFAQRYQASYRTVPSRLASLSYDAMALTISFGKSPVGTRFQAAQITNVQGFNGVNGLFRFRPDGRIERGLAILQVTASGPQVAAQAPTRFQFGF